MTKVYIKTMVQLRTPNRRLPAGLFSRDIFQCLISSRWNEEKSKNELVLRMIVAVDFFPPQILSIYFQIGIFM